MKRLNQHLSQIIGAFSQGLGHKNRLFQMFIERYDIQNVHESFLKPSKTTDK